jgi:hypothetical protein
MAAAALSLALAAGLFLVADLGDLGGALDGDGLPLVLAAVGLYLANGLLKAARWAILLRAAGVVASPGRIYGAFLVGMAVNNLLPTGLAGEPVRLARLEGRMSSAGIAATTADRTLDRRRLSRSRPPAGIPLMAGLDPASVPTIAGRRGTVRGRGRGPPRPGSGGGGAWRLWPEGPPPREERSSSRSRSRPTTRCDSCCWRPLRAWTSGCGGRWRSWPRRRSRAPRRSWAGGAGMAVAIGALVAAAGAPAEAAAALGLVFVATSTWLRFPARRPRRPGRPPHHTTNGDTVDLTVVLPARNEAGNLKAVVEETCAAMRRAGIRGEVLVIDDGSTDDTAAVAAGLTGPGVRLISFAVQPGTRLRHRGGLRAGGPAPPWP